MSYEQELAFAKELAHEAGDIMLRYFRSEDSGATVKEDKTLVTLADTAINTLLIDKTKIAFPSYSVLGEEEQLAVENSEYTWVCDPVDGTMLFVKGLPLSTFSLALVDQAGKSVLGVVYDPYQDRLYEATVGQGALLNGKLISVSGKDSMDSAYINLEMWINEQEGVSFDDPKDQFNKLGAKVTTLCSAIISGCLVSEGSFDAMIFGQSKPEDIAALAVIVEEAGGKVTNLLGNDQRYDTKIYGAIVSNGKIHDQIVEVIASTHYQSKYVNSA